MGLVVAAVEDVVSVFWEELESSVEEAWFHRAGLGDFLEGSGMYKS